MMDRLELETAVEEIQPRRTIDVHGCAEHSLGKRFRRTQVGRRHGEVAECDLYVQRHGDRVARQDEEEPLRRCRDALV